MSEQPPHFGREDPPADAKSYRHNPLASLRRANGPGGLPDEYAASDLNEVNQVSFPRVAFSELHALL